jgi:hypothetical protein
MKQVIAFVVATFFMFVGYSQNQQSFRIELGKFESPEKQDFSRLNSFGLIHSKLIDESQSYVYLSGFDTQKEADATLFKIQSLGFPNARVIALTNQSQISHVVQLTTIKLGLTPDFNQFSENSTLVAYIENQLLKIGIGPFRSAEEARKIIPQMKAEGFQDAFLRTIADEKIITLGEFETGIKKPLIPLKLEQPMLAKNEFLTPKGVQAISAPAVDATIQSKSVSDLQIALKNIGAYSQSIDGYYHADTEKAYKKALLENRELKKYLVLSTMANPLDLTTNYSEFQKILLNIPNSIENKLVLAQQKHPLSKAYLAYIEFIKNGASLEVNTLMNEAIAISFNQKRLEGIHFDPSSTYSYHQLNQLILHLFYIHEVSKEKILIPCWLVNAHPKEIQAALKTLETAETKNIYFEDCAPFNRWEDVRLLQTIATDLSAVDKFDSNRLTSDASFRSQLFLNLMVIPQKEKDKYNQWHEDVWANLETWAKADPKQQEAVTALKIAYHQSRVRLENHYIKMGMDMGNAKALSLATLHTLVSYPLSRFM